MLWDDEASLGDAKWSTSLSQQQHLYEEGGQWRMLTSSARNDFRHCLIDLGGVVMLSFAWTFSFRLAAVGFFFWWNGIAKPLFLVFLLLLLYVTLYDIVTPKLWVAIMFWWVALRSWMYLYFSQFAEMWYELKSFVNILNNKSF